MYQSEMVLFYLLFQPVCITVLTKRLFNGTITGVILTKNKTETIPHIISCAFKLQLVYSIDGYETGRIGHYTSEQSKMKSNKTGLLINYVD